VEILILLNCNLRFVARFTEPGIMINTVNREIFAALKVGEFAYFQLAVDKILRLLQKFNG
jgi:hypothetical protein